MRHLPCQTISRRMMFFCLAVLTSLPVSRLVAAQDGRESSIYIRSLAKAPVCPDSGCYLEKLQTYLSENWSSAPIEVLDAVASQLQKIQSYEYSLNAPEFAGGRALSLDQIKALKTQALVLYWKAFRLAVNQGFSPSLVSLANVVPDESSAKTWMLEIKNDSPIVRSAILKLTAQSNCSDAMRRRFSAVAIYLFKHDTDPGVRGDALVALGQWQSATPETLAVIEQGLTDPRFEDSALEAIIEIGSGAQSLGPILRRMLNETSTLETAPKILRALNDADGNNSESKKIALEFLLDKTNAQDLRFRSIQREAYQLLRRQKSLPDVLPQNLAFLQIENRMLTERFDTAILARDFVLAKKFFKDLDPTPKQIDDLFISAFEWNDKRMLKFLIKNGVEPFTVNEVFKTVVDGNPPNLERLNLILDLGADVHWSVEYGLRSLSARGHLAAVKVLVERHADLHAAWEGALTSAAIKGRTDVVDYLLEHGASLDNLIANTSNYDLRKAAKAGLKTFREFVKAQPVN